MKVVCSYCRQLLGERSPLDRDEISHGMCEPCLEYFRAQWKGMNLDDYLDRFDRPVLAVDPEGRIIGANRLAAIGIGKARSETFARLGGEVMECAFARLPEGCGRTEHCAACTVRMTVQGTFETGRDIVGRRAYVEQCDGRLDLLVSTHLEEGFVRLSIEAMSKADASVVLR